MKKNLIGWLALAAILVVACNKNNDDPTIRPFVTTEFSMDTIDVGQSVDLKPTVEMKDGASFQWKVDNEEVSKDTAYTYTASSRGNHRVVFTASNAAGKDSGVYQIFSPGEYDLGFSLITEGWFGHGTGNVLFYSYLRDELTDSVFIKENPGKALGEIGNTLQYGTVSFDKMYLVVKAGGPLVKVDPYTMKELGRIDNLPGDFGTSFLGLDTERGLLGTNDGVYVVNLSTMTIDGTKVPNITGPVGNMLQYGDRVFALTRDSGIVVFRSTNYSTIKKLGQADFGFAAAKDGLIYAAKDNKLWGMNPNNLAADTITLPFTTTSPWGAWRSVPMTTSSKDNSVYIAPPDGWAGGTKIYRYLKGNASSVSEPFFTLPGGEYFYGAAIAYNAWKNEIVATATNSSYGGNVNYLYFINATSGAVNKKITFNGYHFPAMLLMY